MILFPGDVRTDKYMYIRCRISEFISQTLRRRVTFNSNYLYISQNDTSASHIPITRGTNKTNARNLKYKTPNVPGNCYLDAWVLNKVMCAFSDKIARQKA